MTHLHQPRSLAWQSSTILTGTLLFASAYCLHNTILFRFANGTLLGLAVCCGLTIVAAVMRSVTPFGAITGGILAYSLFLSCRYSTLPWWRSSLLPLLTLFVLTHLATRFRRDRKLKDGIAESRKGRRASQVSANIGVAATFGPLLLAPAGVFSYRPWNGVGMAIPPAVVAALAEAAADTVSSEIGQAIGGEPRLLTNWRRVPIGTDGAVSAAGSLSGVLAAIIVVSVSAVVLQLTVVAAAMALGCAMLGFLFDSLLGATAERKGCLNNDAVNFLSTLVAAIAAGILTNAMG